MTAHFLARPSAARKLRRAWRSLPHGLSGRYFDGHGYEESCRVVAVACRNHDPAYAASSGPWDISLRQLSSTKGSSGVNGETSSSGNDIVDSASATMQWKRDHYQKIEDKFRTQPLAGDDEKNGGMVEDSMSSMKRPDEPLVIDNYEDVQPMWKEMESRVTRRRSLTLEQRGGVSGRRNVRKSDEDVWLQAGVYDSDEKKKD